PTWSELSPPAAALSPLPASSRAPASPRSGSTLLGRTPHEAVHLTEGLEVLRGARRFGEAHRRPLERRASAKRNEELVLQRTAPLGRPALPGQRSERANGAAHGRIVIAQPARGHALFIKGEAQRLAVPVHETDDEAVAKGAAAAEPEHAIVDLGHRCSPGSALR